jgi:hypothetical protein
VAIPAVAPPVGRCADQRAGNGTDDAAYERVSDIVTTGQCPKCSATHATNDSTPLGIRAAGQNCYRNKSEKRILQTNYSSVLEAAVEDDSSRHWVNAGILKAFLSFAGRAFYAVISEADNNMAKAVKLHDFALDEKTS